MKAPAELLAALRNGLVPLFALIDEIESDVAVNPNCRPSIPTEAAIDDAKAARAGVRSVLSSLEMALGIAGPVAPQEGTAMVTLRQLRRFASSLEAHASRMRFGTYREYLEETALPLVDAAKHLLDAGIRLGGDDEYVEMQAVVRAIDSVTNTEALRALTEAFTETAVAFAGAIVEASRTDEDRAEEERRRAANAQWEADQKARRATEAQPANGLAQPDGVSQ